ncbi:prepilin-type N-terminal cleavage/methylation domain-containing protein [Candidatus Nomurabacteria bacterium]|nr:prepilin-type N-terminal cleavage/methylation domain-containing protein [Candidatus Nomurabacteria bacterium]
MQILKPNNNSYGFTLIELLVVISIIGFLASVVLSSLDDARASARDTVRMSDMKAIRQALELYRNKNNHYPGNAEGIGNSGQIIGVGNPIDVAIGPYLAGAVPKDPLHDAGNGVTPTAGAIYFYSYDPLHNIDNCASPSVVLYSAALYGFNRGETISTPDKDTCSGGDVNLNNAIFNKQL